MTMHSNTRMCLHLWCKSKLIMTRYVAHAYAKVQHPVPAHACTGPVSSKQVMPSSAVHLAMTSPRLHLFQLNSGSITGNHSHAQEKLRHGDRANIAG